MKNNYRAAYRYGYSDWATTAIPADVKTMWYRFSRRQDDYCIECSMDGEKFSQMRICHMWEGAETIRFGIYACSPEDSGSTIVFTDILYNDAKKPWHCSFRSRVMAFKDCFRECQYVF